jgi:hypothetical protein
VSNAKFAHSAAQHYGLSLAAADSSGDWNTCTWSTPLCRKGCLTYAGKGPLPKVQRGRILRTQFLAYDPDAFLSLLWYEVRCILARVENPRIRLNVFSDLEWERFAPFLMEGTKGIFYDYTKSEGKALDYVGSESYRVVFSASERTGPLVIKSLLEEQVSVNVVFDKVPAMYSGIPVVDIDGDDDAWRLPPGTLMGVKAKGLMRKSEAFIPFVRRTK